MAEMAFAAHVDMLVVVHNARPPTQSRWEELCRECHRLFVECSRGHDRWSTFVVSDGGGPNVLQRAQLLKALERAPIPTAVVSASSGVWRMHAALQLFNASGSCFGVAELKQALLHLGVGPRRFGDLARVLDHLCSAVPGAHTARELCEELRLEHQRQQLKTDSGIRGVRGGSALLRGTFFDRLLRGA